MNRFHILTLFTQQVEYYFKHSILKRAIENKIISVDAIDMRDYAVNEYGKVDDTLYGGGTGMLIQCQPVFDAYNSIALNSSTGEKPYVVYMSPKGSLFDQKKAKELSKRKDLVIICGHYEGIDDRVISTIVDEQISIGDYVLTGGEVAACVIVDSISRMIPNVLPNEEAYMNESHMNDTLEHLQYTKPEVWKGKRVPQVLLSGDFAKIDEFNKTVALCETWSKRPDMLEKKALSTEEWQKMLEYKKSI
ncbi:MAG: tRNA (guanosine(37)-N1)-methyltransferase TrmD [Saccharofermentanaceae bacterium]|jgi:tRNA (guanine37-N1)-methyltransferase|nr:tRNA (guanosine(37)-N1)-methyltransferase TrmD [Clostridia bacterium]NLX68755.1 tRNA (guanosine(37)-N1)-methyltransferase TrmD [Clostridiaceae bacterium]HOO48313.1 tRNA (guanosine(37)-N1)-methyltransferase TrmD [Saccharofermentans sp.]HPE28147.1 tRNA (guanosine(37)-N1)-methyltransferase TrmD [Saccharofermentans sp.]HPJ80788.1 tRNA (guanosine(37)-N1)-methyltransferase TrmD [Saccharofermentans sp.]